MTVVAAAFVPGMPHLLAEDPAPSWRKLADATREVGVRLRRLEPHAVLLMSTQWFTVLGHQLQLGQHVAGDPPAGGVAQIVPASRRRATSSAP